MSDRYQGLTVVFDKELRREDALRIADAIQQIRGVQLVQLGELADPMARASAKMDLRKQVIALLDAECFGGGS